MESANINKDIENIEFDGDHYVRINPEDVCIDNMSHIQKIKDVIALKVTSGTVKIITRHGDDIETTNFAEVGDYIVYNIGASDKETLKEQMLDCDKKVIKSHNFHKLYSDEAEGVALSLDDVKAILDDLADDNEDNADFTDYNVITSATQRRYIGKEIGAYQVPFNFVISAPWGQDQFIKKGGYLAYNPNTSTAQMRDMYGIHGAHDRKAGQMEKTYSLTDDAISTTKENVIDGKPKKTINDTFKMVIKADRSPIAGIQFNNIDMAKAYDKAGKDLPSNLAKYEHFVH